MKWNRTSIPCAVSLSFLMWLPMAKNKPIVEEVKDRTFCVESSRDNSSVKSSEYQALTRGCIFTCHPHVYPRIESVNRMSHLAFTPQP